MVVVKLEQHTATTEVLVASYDVEYYCVFLLIMNIHFNHPMMEGGMF